MGWVTDWLTSIGTVGSAGAAVYLGVYEPRRRRPQLSTGKPELGVAQTGMGGDPDVLANWLRVPVSNAKKHDAAEDVEVFLNSVRSGPSAEQLVDRGLAGSRWRGLRLSVRKRSSRPAPAATSTSAS